MNRTQGVPKDEIWVGEEIGDALEHRSRFEDECWKRHLTLVREMPESEGGEYSRQAGERYGRRTCEQETEKVGS